MDQPPVLSREHLKEIPMKPGVYLMMDKTGNVLYVGKARELKRRLASYQRFLSETHSKTGVLLVKVSRIDTILTNTEKEALILEASLIKKYRPRYNVILRDDKNYPYLKVTIAEQWPRLLMTRRRSNDGSRYFGPFSSAVSMRNTLRYLNRIFPLRRCSKQELEKRSRPCLNYQMGRCLAPCTGFLDSLKYQVMVADLLLALEGRNRSLLMELKKRMTIAADKLEFEEAARCRDQIESISQTLEKQVVVAAHFLDQDVFGLFREQGAVAVAVIFVREGVINGHRSFFLPEAIGEDDLLLSAVLEQFYSDGHQPVPQEIILPFEPDGLLLLKEWLAELKGARIRIKIPKRGEGLSLLNLAVQNAQQLLEEKVNQEKAWELLAAAIARQLKLSVLPHRIECFDISNIGGQHTVGSLVSFVKGVADKKGYRHFRIKELAGPNDYLMIATVLARRFDKIKSEGQSWPDLIVVDGGKGQLNAAISVLDEFGMAHKIELAAIAKGREGESDRIFRPGRKNPIVFLPNSSILLFFMRIRDEAHRFGITFHRRLRGKTTSQSVLDNIPGIGPVKKKALLKSLGSIKRVENASLTELAQVSGIGTDLAKKIKDINS